MALTSAQLTAQATLTAALLTFAQNNAARAAAAEIDQEAFAAAQNTLLINNAARQASQTVDQSAVNAAQNAIQVLNAQLADAAAKAASGQ